MNATFRLRPDPLEASGGLNSQAGVDVVQPKLSAIIRVIKDSPDARLALMAMVISQATMIAVMTMTPVHLKLHGNESISAYVISLHIAGMYAFSPLVGKFSDARGRLPTITVGAVLLIMATLLSALAGDRDSRAQPGPGGA